MKTIILAVIAALAIVSAQAAEIGLAWNPNPEPDIAGYRVYWGTASRVYNEPIDVPGAPQEPQFKVVDLPDSGIAFFAVTAYNAAGLESIYSDEISVDLSKPSPPGGLRIKIGFTVEVQIPPTPPAVE